MQTITENTKGAKTMTSSNLDNPVGLDGIEFIEYTSPDPQKLIELFDLLGFKKIAQHKTKKVSLYNQNRINFILNEETETFAESFSQMHGPSVCATGFRVKEAQQARTTAIKRGAQPCAEDRGHSFPCIKGIGDSAVYFIDGYQKGSIYSKDFESIESPENIGFGLERIDHLTNNVPQGEMQKWCNFYEGIFNFKETRFFDIKGEKTGLISKVMTSPCRKITIPINEPSDEKSQIQEYLDEYKGSGIQHIALMTNDICRTVRNLREQGIEFLATPNTYYEQLLKRLPHIEEDIDELQSLGILADGDKEGYLLQIFTKNLIGPIFYEIIQRKNHDGFGEGNFQALFDAIEEDQRRRGYL